MRKKRLPNFYYENRLWKKGFKYVAGMDEVGRGCFAGPIVAGAVAFATCTALTFRRELRLRSQGASVRGKPVCINDSKKMTSKQREIADKWIRENAATWGMGEASVFEINRLGMGKATKVAFRRAVGNANQRFHKRIEYLLIDAFYVPYVRGFPMRTKKARSNHKLKDSRSRQLAIKNGDEKSISIAAASIIAKVYRDDLMIKLGSRKHYKAYDWINNKGYGTKKHQEALLKYKNSRHHRKQFVETFITKARMPRV